MVREERKLEYISSSKKDLEKLPLEVKEVFIHGLELALVGEKHPDAEPLKGFGDASVLEIRERHKGDAYRAMYTVSLKRPYMFSMSSKRRAKLELGHLSKILN